MTPRAFPWAILAALSAGVACCGLPGPMPERPDVADYRRPVVLLVGPDSGEVHHLREQLGDDFHAVADDAMWYRAAALQLLDSLGIPHVEVGRGAARFRVDGRPRLVSWESVDRIWFAVVYDGATEPRIAADVDLRGEVGRLSRSSVVRARDH